MRMNGHIYTPLQKTVLLAAIGERPPVNGTVRIHIKQKLTDGTVLSNSIEKFPSGHEIDLTNTHVLSSLIDELLAMVPGEISEYLCKREDVGGGMFNLELPPGQDLLLEVEMLDWYGQDISADRNGSLRKTIVEEGNSRGRPCWTGKCNCKIKRNDESADEILFRLGDGASYNVPRPVEECLLTMQRNESCRLVTPSDTFHITLTAFEKEKQLWGLPIEEVMKLAEDLKIRGNNAYKVNKLRLAQLYYERCLSYIESTSKSEQDEKCAELVKTCNLNLAQVYMKMENYPKVVSYSTTVLWMDRNSIKALYRRAQAYNEQGYHEEAIADLNRLLQTDKHNSDARKLLEVVRGHQKQKSNKERSNMKSVFQQIEDQYAKEAAAEEPSVSVWDEATATCPEELATEEAYAVYRETLDEEEKARKAEAAEREAAYLAANPPKKKKKRKKKKKPVISEVPITEVEEIKLDEIKPEVVPEPDEGMKYEVTAEKTFVNKIDDVSEKTQNTVTNGDKCSGTSPE